MENRAFDYSRYKDWIDPAEVTPYAQNAKKHDERQIRNIANSIKRFGWHQDCVLTKDKVVVIGHGRRLAALQIGCKIPYHTVDKDADELTEEDIRELREADNLTNAMTGFDVDLLSLDFSELGFEGFDFDLGDFTTDDIPGGVSETKDTPEVQLQEKYQLIVDCEDEVDMQQKYDTLQEAGIECRVSTL